MGGVSLVRLQNSRRTQLLPSCLALLEKETDCASSGRIVKDRESIVVHRSGISEYETVISRTILSRKEALRILPHQRIDGFDQIVVVNFINCERPVACRIRFRRAVPQRLVRILHLRQVLLPAHPPLRVFLRPALHQAIPVAESLASGS